jgi:hypothetical protein
LLPIGKYKAVVIDHGFGESKSGKEFIALEFRVTEGEHEGQTCAWKGWFTDKAARWTLGALKHCGWDGASLKNLGDLDAPVLIVVEHEVGDDGVTRAKVRYVNDPNAGGLGIKTKLESDRIADLDERIKSNSDVPF